jgi:hypothetical protein
MIEKKTVITEKIHEEEKLTTHLLQFYAYIELPIIKQFLEFYGNNKSLLYKNVTEFVVAYSHWLDEKSTNLVQGMIYSETKPLILTLVYKYETLEVATEVNNRLRKEFPEDCGGSDCLTSTFFSNIHDYNTSYNLTLHEINLRFSVDSTPQIKSFIYIVKDIQYHNKRALDLTRELPAYIGVKIMELLTKQLYIFTCIKLFGLRGKGTEHREALFHACDVSITLLKETSPKSCKDLTLFQQLLFLENDPVLTKDFCYNCLSLFNSLEDINLIESLLSELNSALNSIIINDKKDKEIVFSFVAELMKNYKLLKVNLEKSDETLFRQLTTKMKFLADF